MSGNSSRYKSSVSDDVDAVNCKTIINQVVNMEFLNSFLFYLSFHWIAVAPSLCSL